MLARVSKEDIARWDAEVVVERLVESRGVVLAGRDADRLVGLCPWCSTIEGLVVDRRENRWGCGSCHREGGAVDWVRRIEGVSLTHAVELLREGLPLSGPALGSGGPPKVGTRRLLPGLPVGLPDEALLAEVVGFYHRALLECPEAAGFLERR